MIEPGSKPKSIEDLKRICAEKYPYKAPKWYALVLEGKFNFKIGKIEVFDGVSIIRHTYIFPFLSYLILENSWRVEFGWLKKTIVIRYVNREKKS